MRWICRPVQYTEHAALLEHAGVYLLVLFDYVAPYSIPVTRLYASDRDAHPKMLIHELLGAHDITSLLETCGYAK